jgi:predicted RNA-binding Zn-ribbon protein involved in translation (DUF1610 family)
MVKAPRVTVQCTSCKSERVLTVSEIPGVTVCPKCGNPEKVVRPAR